MCLKPHNKHADALAMLTSKVDVPNEAIDMRIMMKILGATVTDLRFWKHKINVARLFKIFNHLQL